MIQECSTIHPLNDLCGPKSPHVKSYLPKICSREMKLPFCKNVSSQFPHVHASSYSVSHLFNCTLKYPRAAQSGPIIHATSGESYFHNRSPVPPIFREPISARGSVYIQIRVHRITRRHHRRECQRTNKQRNLKKTHTQMCITVPKIHETCARARSFYKPAVFERALYKHTYVHATPI